MGVIDAINLTKRYGDIEVLHGLTFSIEEKSITLVIGPNGAGKSTLLKIIGGLINRTSGYISVLGEDPWNSNKIPRKVGIILDRPFLPPYLTVIDIVKEVSSEFSYPLSDAKRLLEDFNLVHFMKNKVRELSAGTKQKLQIVFSLIKNPEIIIADEPTANLDITSRYEVYNTFAVLREKMGLTVLISSHIPAEILAFSTHVLAINNGIMKFFGKVDKLLRNNFLEEFYIVVDNIGKALEALKDRRIEVIGNQIRISGNLAEISKILSNAGVRIFYVRNSIIDKSIKGETGWE
ncbi:ABC transporter ATP-binding protein [Saccharolobus solfataricus]|uniref:ABC transporter, ATP binding protein, putative n=2 Tax=Saccharolobus solfataricus TaxID=2287 RepID=Q97UD4_SACS2|nr:ABC transporter ATP-binding protein [Saccharolobus solfataricus]AAK43187.1 ABC transporter, ATP binding protein, putative [Saccharolobus solfataricus P2]AKA73219.1 ABC transporter ATP-binding protein [Saccharolobus solfataricus]AKA75919.1 ABC transporter ATP-binding protein [Saccharolobus solfataricus]AKA78611.1 ABC transporter ATP-binding protein [Saccharolobus solfataricus]AZF67687.1 ABC transporter ATP-binding protein [Saccharolobus solfataricus]